MGGVIGVQVPDLGVRGAEFISLASPISQVSCFVLNWFFQMDKFAHTHTHTHTQPVNNRTLISLVKAKHLCRLPPKELFGIS